MSDGPGQWDPYPGSIPASMPCAECGLGPIAHALVTDHRFVALWPGVDGIDDPEFGTVVRDDTA